MTKDKPTSMYWKILLERNHSILILLSLVACLAIWGTTVHVFHIPAGVSIAILMGVVLASPLPTLVQHHMQEISVRPLAKHFFSFSQLHSNLTLIVIGYLLLAIAFVTYWYCPEVFPMMTFLILAIAAVLSTWCIVRLQRLSLESGHHGPQQFARLTLVCVVFVSLSTSASVFTTDSNTFMMKTYQSTTPLIRMTGIDHSVHQDKSSHINHLINEGHVARQTGKHALAHQKYKEAIRIAESANYPLETAHATVGLGHLHRIQGNRADAKEQYNKALKQYQALSFLSGEAQALTGLGYLNQMVGNLQNAKEDIVKAHVLFVQAKDQLGEAQMLKVLGDFEHRLGNVNQAFNRYEQALQLYQHLNNRQGTANVFTRLADLHRLMANDIQPELLIQAEKGYEQARELYKSLNPPDHHGLANVTAGLGHLARKQGRNTEAEAYYRDARSMYAEIKDLSGEANLLTGQADLEVRLGKYYLAQRHYAQALELYQHLGDQIGIANIRTRIEEMSHFQGVITVEQKIYKTTLTMENKLDLSTEISRANDIPEKL